MDNAGSDGVAPRRNSRNKTNMQDFLNRTKNEKRTIEFDANGVPAGKSKSNFQSYLGWFLRETVPCTVNDWKTADKETIKDPLWAHMKVRTITFLDYNILVKTQIFSP